MNVVHGRRIMDRAGLESAVAAINVPPAFFIKFLESVSIDFIVVSFL
jgi:hypothetical protein